MKSFKEFYIEYMRLKLFFTKSDTSYKDDIYDHTLSFLHGCLGKNNKYHSAFSNYSITPPLGYVVEGDSIKYPNGASMYINSNDNEFINNVVKGILNNKSLKIGDMNYCGMEMYEYNVHSDYDMVRSITPILLKNKEDGKYITYKDRDDYFKLLEAQCKKKLLHCGFNENKVNKLKFIPFHLENAKTKYVKFKKGCLPTSQLMFIVEGDRTLRKNLYELGFGNLTGCGFGNIEINKR